MCHDSRHKRPHAVRGFKKKVCRRFSAAVISLPRSRALVGCNAWRDGRYYRQGAVAHLKSMKALLRTHVSLGSYPRPWRVLLNHATPPPPPPWSSAQPWDDLVDKARSPLSHVSVPPRRRSSNLTETIEFRRGFPLVFEFRPFIAISPTEEHTRIVYGLQPTVLANIHQPPLNLWSCWGGTRLGGGGVKRTDGPLWPCAQRRKSDWRSSWLRKQRYGLSRTNT